MCFKGLDKLIKDIFKRDISKALPYVSQYIRQSVLPRQNKSLDAGTSTKQHFIHFFLYEREKGPSKYIINFYHITKYHYFLDIKITSQAPILLSPPVRSVKRKYCILQNFRI